jgi:adenylate kinase
MHFFSAFCFPVVLQKKIIIIMAATKKTKKKSNNEFEEEDDVDDQRQKKKKTKTTKKDDDDDEKKTRTKIKKVALLKNILICGTPGTGKSTLAKLVLEKVNNNNNNNNKRICYEYVNVGDVCKAKKFYHSFDERLNSFVIDEDKILDHLEPLVRRGGMILDYHSSEFFPERFFSHVIVLTCGRENTKILYERLEKRDGYTKEKIRQNVECEIFGECVEEAKEAYTGDGVVHVRSNETEEEMEETVKFIAEELLGAKLR